MNKYLARPFRLYRRHGYFREYLQTCGEKKLPPKLHVGCGNRPIAGWCNVDVAHLTDQVHYLDALKRFPFEDESFQFVFSEHFIEHLRFEDGLKFFKETARILKRGGVIRTATPDLDFLCELRTLDSDAKKRYAEYISQNFAPHMPVSGATCANTTFYGWGHAFIWNASLMQEVLKPLGFGDFKAYKPGKSSVAEFKDLEQHGKSVPAEINDLETFVLEATKQ
jgi:SAM-dependent methyltransferase